MATRRRAGCDCPLCPVCGEHVAAVRTSDINGPKYTGPPFAVTLCGDCGAFYVPASGPAVGFDPVDISRLGRVLGVRSPVAYWVSYLVGVLFGARRALARAVQDKWLATALAVEPPDKTTN